MISSVDAKTPASACRLLGVEALGSGDLEALLRNVGSATCFGALGESRHLQDLEILVAHVLEPVACVARRDRAFVWAELADQHIARSVEAHAALQHHPEARRRGVVV